MSWLTHKLNPKLAISFLILLIVIAAAAGWLIWQNYRSVSTTTKTQSTSQNIPYDQPDPVSARMNLMFFGDLIPTREVDNWSAASPLKYVYPFAGLKTFDRSKYDAWIGDLDCPITDSPLSFTVEKTQSKFNCEPQYFTEAAKWFDALSLATNHTGDRQEINGFAQTRNYLKQNNIQYFGHFDNSVTTDICEVVSLPSRFINAAGKTIEEDDEVRLPIALCAFHNVFRQASGAELAVIKQYAPYLPTFVMPHMGAEYQPAADSLKVGAFRKMIDLGADAVIGNHPHWVQNTEVYKDKLIAYSLGNFIFDQHFEPDVMRSVGINLDLSIKYDDNLKQWQALADECAKFQDKCLSRAKAAGLKKPEFSIKYDLAGVDASRGQPTRASQSLLNQLLARTNWRATLKALGQ